MEINKKILGGMINDSILLDKGMSKLREDYFKGEDKKLFQLLKQMYEDREPIDATTVTLKNKLNPLYVVEVTAITTLRTSYDALIEAKVNQFIKADLTTFSLQLNSDLTPEQALIKLRNKADSIEGAITTENKRDMPTVFKEIHEEIENAKQSGGVTGVATGYTEIDRVTRGFQKGNLVILAGRPGMGKSTVALEFFKEAAKIGSKTLLFNLEMSDREVYKKLLSSESNVMLENIKSGDMTTAQWQDMQQGETKLMKTSLEVVDNATMTDLDIAAYCRKKKREEGLDMVVIDYLQLMTCSDESKKSANDQTEYLSRQMKLLAKDLDIPVIVLSQLSRSVEQRDNKRPMLSDLRNSGAIEQDADVVIFVYRPFYYGIDTDENGNDCRNTLETIFAKNRMGKIGVVEMHCDLRYSKIYDKPTAADEYF